MADDEKPTMFADLASLDLRETQMEIYSRPIGIAPLFVDPVSGAEHYLIRYPPGTVARRHRHSAAHTMVVIEGVLEANGELLGAGSYAHFPGGTPMLHQPGPGQRLPVRARLRRNLRRRGSGRLKATG